jgi:hypothetical protein
MSANDTPAEQKPAHNAARAKAGSIERYAPALPRPCDRDGISRVLSWRHACITSEPTPQSGKTPRLCDGFLISASGLRYTRPIHRYAPRRGNRRTLVVFRYSDTDCSDGSFGYASVPPPGHSMPGRVRFPSAPGGDSKPGHCQVPACGSRRASPPQGSGNRLRSRGADVRCSSCYLATSPGEPAHVAATWVKWIPTFRYSQRSARRSARIMQHGGRRARSSATRRRSRGRVIEMASRGP